MYIYIYIYVHISLYIYAYVRLFRSGETRRSSGGPNPLWCSGPTLTPNLFRPTPHPKSQTKKA